MDRYEARKAMVADLEEQGYLVKSCSTFHNVGTMTVAIQRRASDQAAVVC